MVQPPAFRRPRGDAVEPLARVRAAIDTGRLGVYSAFGAAASAVPLPWIPGELARRVRGALVHDIAIRHGVSLSGEAREVLSETTHSAAPRSALAGAARFVGARIAARTFARIAPVGALWPAAGAVRTYALGRLFDRYLETRQNENDAAMDGEEARRVRTAMDRALVRSLSRAARRRPEQERTTPLDDPRDATTAFIDGLLELTAGLPSRLVHRLDEAFDEELANAMG